MGHDHEGQRVSRRRLFAGISSVGLGSLLAACGPDKPAVTTSTGAVVTPDATTAKDLTSLFAGANTCTLTATTTQGPYYFDADKVRGDIREDKQGVRLRLAIKVQDSETCKPLSNAVVEIWHCDAGGVYSGFESASTGGGRGAPGGPPGSSGDTSNGSYSTGDSEASPTDDGTYLRGAQVTDPGGIVQFATIYPGWYRGRTVHIHLKVHLDKKTVLTTQLYMDEAVNDAVFATAPYREHTGRDTTNDNDDIFDTSGLLTLQRQGSGYLGVVNLGIA